MSRCRTLAYCIRTSVSASNSVLLGRSVNASKNAKNAFKLHRGFATVDAKNLTFGQPVHETHPHILEAGELTPGITALEYAQRRAKLAGKLPKKSIAILAASDVKYRSGAVFYEFKQDTNFYYLTGFNEPEALAVISKSSDENDFQFHLLLRPKDAQAELWDGARSGTQAALDVFNADASDDIARAGSLLPDLLASADHVYTDIPLSPTTPSTFARFFSPQTRPNEGFTKILASKHGGNVQPLKPLLNDLRAFKSPAEIALMRRVGQMSGRAITQTFRRPWTRERDLTAYLEFEMKAHGCDASAYVPVVAGGKNALSIHYVRNDDVLRAEDMVLVDAGGEYGGYIADITRTYPLSGRFSSAQRDLYEAVLDVQRRCVALCREDAGTCLDELHAEAERGLRENLRGIGFDVSGKALEALFPHHVGHYIGLDVHDTPGYSRKIKLQAGHCVTVEPGVYVPDTAEWPKHFRGMGIRIEDSVAVEKTEPRILTTEAIKEVDGIEWHLRGSA